MYFHGALVTPKRNYDTSGVQRCAPLSHFDAILGKRSLQRSRFGGTI
jgi:hypothetical protein